LLASVLHFYSGQPPQHLSGVDKVTKIARSLRRTVAATAVKARALGIPLDARG
jgi:hypothetical protein